MNEESPKTKTLLTNKAMPGIIGKKLGMSHTIQDDGRVIPITFIRCQPNTVVQIKTDGKDGYPALVLGFDAYHKPTKNKKFKALKEFRIENVDAFQKGQTFDLTQLKDAKTVTVTGISKGKGFQGVVKRLPVPSRTRIDRYACQAWTREQGASHGWTHGCRTDHHRQSTDHQIDSRKGIARGQGIHSRRQQFLRIYKVLKLETRNLKFETSKI
jgi:ribosomal protein L3